MANKRYGKKNWKNIPKKEIKEYLNNEVFSRDSFNNHISEVSHNLNIDKEIVEYVIKHYITSIMLVINSVRKIQTKINIYAYFSLFIDKGKKHF